jgi:hydroxymethylpyrimidine pyrophosphatase-like HAD family hydrolase
MLRFRASGRRLLLVTGRELPELQAVCPHLNQFDVVVAENGGLLFWPESGKEEVLGKPVPEAFIAEMIHREVKPFSVGKCIFATWRPHETCVLETIKRLGLDFHIIFNKHAVMVLPNDVSKATGLLAAAERFGLTPAEIVGVGDAENDFSFLRVCGVSAAVANALDVLKDQCGIVLAGDHGRGVAELIDGILADELTQLAGRSMGRDRLSTKP